MHLDPKNIISNPEEFNKSMGNRGEIVDSEEVSELYTQWRDLNLESEQVAAQLNSLSKNFQPGNLELINQLKEEQIKLQEEVKVRRADLDHVLDRIPNLLDEAVPYGKTSDDNVVVEYIGKKPNIPHPVHHEDIAIKLGMWSRDEAVNMSGSRFVCLTGKLAKLERALGQFALDSNVEAGFTEMSVPYLVLKHALYNTGQLPKFQEDFFQLDSFALIPTGEIPLVNYYANKTLPLEQLPIKVTALTPCFRSEAGSLGRDTKGLIRVHQFQKVEMVAITTPEDSEKMHFELLGRTKSLLDALGLHYRVVEICSGDIGFTASRQFDVEVWMPSQDKYVEVASCSNCKDFQARRMRTKYASKDKSQSGLVHTLNCTAIACGRVAAAILETYCFSGEFIVPDILHGYWKP